MGMKKAVGGWSGGLCPPWWQASVECVLHSSTLFDDMSELM